MFTGLVRYYEEYLENIYTRRYTYVNYLALANTRRSDTSYKYIYQV
jgi:hypothetical protein